jgi:hypothetical protein
MDPSSASPGPTTPTRDPGDQRTDRNVPPVAGAGIAGQLNPKPVFFSGALLEPLEDPAHIRLFADPDNTPTPAIWELVREIFAVARQILRQIRVLFGSPKYKKERVGLYTTLLSSAEALCGQYNIEAAWLNIAETKNEISDEFPTLRDELWKSYLTITVCFALTLGPIGCAIYYHLLINHVFSDHNTTLLKQAPAFPQLCIALVWIPFGVAIGIFLEFVFRVSENLTYARLLAINPGRWKPWRRTASTVITAYVFAFIVGVGAFQIGIGSILLNDFISTRPWLSVAVGFVTGFTFPYVRDIVTQFKPERRDVPPDRAVAE